ncbi:replicative DNA helicase [Scrofimicrobium sp. R131]|uniref:Replicative DNA helicase n=1 Tax=Scrofimicrobium appendicitidis TaxID=3079930 RepID=A0AAU7V8N8_9ACTO
MDPLSDGFDRVPPHDVEAEQAVLGSMMLSKDAIMEVAEILTSADYYQPAHETIHDTIVELSSQGAPTDVITVAGELKRAGHLQRIGGAPYLHTLVSLVPTAANAAYYARHVRENAILRRLVSAGTRIVQLGYAQDGGDVDDIVDAAQAEVFAIAEKRQREDYIRFADMSEAILEELEDIASRDGKLSGVPTGFEDLDRLTQGLHGGQMIIIAARPAMGKSTLALDFCRSASLHKGITSAIFSLEMSRSEIAMRLLSAETGVFLSKMRSGQMTPEDWTRVSKRLSDVASAPLYIDDSPNLTMMEIRSKCRRLKQQQNLGLVVVDYLQLMTSGKKVESRQQEVSEFSRQLKLLAKELDIPVVAVAQLNRGPEARTDKKPMIADLRESGSLEQDADVIMLLHRPDYYNEDERVGEADIIVAKHRNGETRTIPVAFQGQLARFANMARSPGPGADPF